MVVAVKNHLGFDHKRIQLNPLVVPRKKSDQPPLGKPIQASVGAGVAQSSRKALASESTAM
jgi:hypothetical protein